MRHKVFGRKFSRTSKQRKALFLSLGRALIEKGEITTTLAKAKSTRSFFERLLTRAKKADLASRREVHKVLRETKLVNKLVGEIAPVFKNRAGGYLKIIKLGQRKGDAAPMAKVVFVEKIEKLEPEKPQETKQIAPKKEGEKDEKDKEQN